MNTLIKNHRAQQILFVLDFIVHYYYYYLLRTVVFN
jgi:hypothetical protein